MRFDHIDVDGVEKLRRFDTLTKAHIGSADKDNDPDSESSYMLRLQGQKITALMRHKEELSKTTGVQRYKHIIVVDMNV